ncbi:hypothetical protein CHUAL_011862 [Chamberlinius hualienensis]
MTHTVIESDTANASQQKELKGHGDGDIIDDYTKRLKLVRRNRRVSHGSAGSFNVVGYFNGSLADIYLMAVLLLILVVWAEMACPSVSLPHSKEKEVITIGMILPNTSFSSRFRQYVKQLSESIEDLKKKNPSFNFLKYYTLLPEVSFMSSNPSPIDILHVLCQTALPKNFTVILYLINVEFYGSSPALAQYFFQLAGYLGIPVFSWNAYSSGLEQKVSKNIVMQMAPSVGHQSAAMLSILKRYSWHQFSIVTSRSAGHREFIQAVRDQMAQMQQIFRFTMLATVKVDTQEEPEVIKNKLAELLNTDTRIILLYCNRAEAAIIFSAATELGLVGESYMWIITQSAVGKVTEFAPESFPIGTFGVYFDSSLEDIDNTIYIKEIDNAVKVIGHGLDMFVSDPKNHHISLNPNLSCNNTGTTRWSRGEGFVRYLRNVSIPSRGGKPYLEFNPDGTLKYAELTVINLNTNLKWDTVGKWTPFGLEVRDIVWPGNSMVHPPGVPEKFHLKVMFMVEPPFIIVDPPDPVTGKCINRGVLCAVNKESADINSGNVTHNPRNHSHCCSGFSIDLLVTFATDLDFTYELTQVEDGYWGADVNGHWNGLVAALINHKADIVMTSFTINSMREAVIDFSSPFMETGIAIVVAKRTGIISPKAFLEPFDTVSWWMILFVSIHVACFSIFVFEWLSPSGYNRQMQPPSDYKFSLLRTYWMVWADLFGASVNVDCPRSFAARFMSSVWAMFAVVFLAIYTANLAAVMITREEYHDLSGIDDRRLSNPYANKPPFRFGTVPFGNTEAVIQRNLPHYLHYMKQYNKTSVAEGIKAVKKGELDAFIYDATVLDYLVGQDDECKLLTVGNWYATSGYGIGFPRSSKYLALFNRQMMIYKENGDLDRLQRYWLTGGCQPRKQERSSSKPLSLDQFMSAFLLLSLGIILSVMFLLIEYVYFHSLRKPLAKQKISDGCCALVSLSMGKSLTPRDATYKPRDNFQGRTRDHTCRDPACEKYLLNVRQELGMAQYRIYVLEKMLENSGSRIPSEVLKSRVQLKRMARLS